MRTIPEKPWFLSSLLAFIGQDCADAVGFPAAFARDIITVSERVSHEGESFLTKTLPNFGKVIDFALQERGPLAQTMFKKRRPGSALPAFLQGLTVRVFDEEGYVLAQPCILSIRLLRQICFWCKKLERGYSDRSLQRALSDLIETDRAIPRMGEFIPPRELGYAKGLIRQLFLDYRVDRYGPKHGPGAVAGGENLVEKRRLKHKFKNLESMFRPIPTFFSLRDAAEDPGCITDRIECEFGLSRIAFVEKDSSGPRIIGLEPSEYQWCQQSLKRSLYEHIETHPRTRGHVNFTDQEVNRSLSLNWRDYDTLDMSKASDRNSLALVTFLFQGTNVLPYLLASRTPGTILPDGTILMYNKFAPMGSATCFPVQALVYWALAVTALKTRCRMPLSVALRHVYVYGDDLIVPHGYSQTIFKLFESVGLKFNVDKCCVSGKFRESCGLDAYDGVDVTPVRLRRTRLTRDLTSFIPCIEHANALFDKGYWASACILRELVEMRLKKLKIILPCSRDALPVLYWRSEVDNFRILTRDSISSVKGWVVEPKKIRVPADVERKCLRESLSLGGPVGTFRTGSRCDRYLALKYACVARKRRVIYHPGNTSHSVCEVGHPSVP